MKYANFTVGNNKYICLVSEQGEIIARNVKGKIYHKKLHVNNFVNNFPCNDDDFIILTARQELFKSFGVRHRDLSML